METIKLGNLSDWRVLEGKYLSFTAPEYERDKPRKVRLDLNCEVAANWYIEAGGKHCFLAAVPAGLSALEFQCAGDFNVGPAIDDFEVQYWTVEAEAFWTEGDGETFSTIYERQPRNEALEYIMFQAAQNQLRRDKAHAAELAELRAAIGAINGREDGIHGGEAEEYQEPRPKPAKAGGKSADPKPLGGRKASVPAGAQADGSGGPGAAGEDTGAAQGDTSK